MRSSFPRKMANFSVCAAFVALLWIPLAALWISPGSEIIEAEKRRAAPFPEIRFAAGYLKAFPPQFEAFFQDRFSFRGWLIANYNRFKIAVLGSSPSRTVIIGKDGHLFLANSPPGEDWKDMQPYSAHELNQWRDLYQSRHDEFAKHGIQYLVVIGPDKQTIYPDYLPDLLRARTPQRSRFDELLEHLRSDSTVNILDLRPVLREARTREEVYYRKDTHWNAAGGYLAYREIVFALQRWLPHLEPLARDQLDYHFKMGTGDLAQMLNVASPATERCPDSLSPKRPRARLEWGRDDSPFAKFGDRKLGRESVSDADEPHPARLIVFTDSFGGQLQPLLAQHFRRIDFVPCDHMSRQIVVAQRPDVVLQVMVERKLLNPPHPDEP